MDDIIKSIIEIDRGASKRIEDAEKDAENKKKSALIHMTYKVRCGEEGRLL